MKAGATLTPFGLQNNTPGSVQKWDMQGHIDFDHTKTR
jgi:hypothetical protein